MKKLLGVCAMAICVVAHAKDIKYPVSAIPAALKENVNAVIREDETIFTITSPRTSTVHFHLVTTIFNSSANDLAITRIGYDKMTKIKDLKASAYDAEGESIKKIRSSEIIDRAAFDGVSLFSDNRIKIIDLTQSSYPYTVEIEYDLDYDYLLFMDGSAVGATEKISTQYFKYQLNYPVELRPRYRAHNIDTKPVITTNAGQESVTWVLDNIPTVKREPLSPRSRYVQRIEAAPNAVEMSGYKGDMSSWVSMGKWFSTLLVGRDKLPEPTKRKVHELTDGLKTNEEKAKAIYEYMQSKTRYVSIQLGIGGWQPFEASTVDEVGYGDCKALSNYTVAMLKEVGVPAFYAIITAGRGERSFDPSFPNPHANHVVAAVPLGKDTIWLECTSQTKSFGYAGDFTDNRTALAVTESGGKIVRTPYYPTEVNTQIRVAEVNLDAMGNAKAKVTTNYSGLQYENGGLDYVLVSSYDDQKKWVQNNTSIPNFEVGQFSFANKKGKIPTAVVNLDLTLNKYASVTNKRIFMTPNLMNRSTYIPEKVENRKTPFVLGTGYVDIDTIKYRIPESIYPEFLPPNAKFESRFGTYESGFKIDQGSVIYFRKMTKKDGEFPPEVYQEYVDFYKNINKADNTKLVFVNKT